MPAPEMILPRYFTEAEIARALGVSRKRFAAIMAAGRGPETVRMSSRGRRLIRDDRLAAWAEANTMRLARR